jgi:SAM-dependent MidA family methyltransferase
MNPRQALFLPKTAAKERHALSLRNQIEEEIRRRGPILLSRYMQICLYDPAHGYYSANAEQFGKAGDFYTSSDVHAVFGRLMARQFEEVWRTLDRPSEIEILELGPGRGLFARDLLDWSKKKFPDFFAALTYTLQEASPPLRAKLRENLSEHIPLGKAKAPEACTSGLCRTLAHDVPIIVFANEFFDALPVEILSTQGQLYIALENNRLHEIWLPPGTAELEFLDRYGVHPEAGERIEVPLISKQCMAQICESVGIGVVMITDYGYTRGEQLAGRHRGTLMCYRHHSAGSNPYEAPGEQDLTAHVNFTALAAACEQAGLRGEKLVTQSQLLMGIGEANEFADVFEECRLPQERAKVALQLKHLITPEGMGENFRVLIASKEMSPKKVSALSALKFDTAASSAARLAEK